jgi:hypothetical protein
MVTTATMTTTTTGRMKTTTGGEVRVHSREESAMRVAALQLLTVHPPRPFSPSFSTTGGVKKKRRKKVSQATTAKGALDQAQS